MEEKLFEELLTSVREAGKILSMKTKKLSFERHQEIGRELKTINLMLSHLSIEIHNTYGVSKKVSKNTEKVLTALGDLRSELDNILTRDCPDKSNAELNSCYYGNQKVS